MPGSTGIIPLDGDEDCLMRKRLIVAVIAAGAPFLAEPATAGILDRYPAAAVKTRLAIVNDHG